MRFGAVNGKAMSLATSVLPLALLAISSESPAAAYTASVSGYWGNPVVWGGSGYPNQPGDTMGISQSLTLTLADAAGADASFTVASINAGTGSQNFTLQNTTGGTGTITIHNNGAAGAVRVTKNSGKYGNIDVRLVLHDDLNITSLSAVGANFKKAIMDEEGRTDGRTPGIRVLGQVGTGSAQSIVDTRISAAASYTGWTTIDGSDVSGTAGSASGGGKLIIGLHNALPVGTILSVKGATRSYYAQGGEFKMAGFNQEVAGLTDAGASAYAVGKITSSASATLTINNADAYTFNGAIGGIASIGSPISLVKKGVGTQTLAGPNTYTGNTTIENGALALSSTGSLVADINSTGVSTQLLGNAALTTDLLSLDGTLKLDVTDVTAAGTWQLVDLANLSPVSGSVFGSNFKVTLADGTLFSENADVWSLTQLDKTYQFSEATGALVVTIPEPASAGLLTAVIGLGVLRRRR